MIVDVTIVLGIWWACAIAALVHLRYKAAASRAAQPKVWFEPPHSDASVTAAVPEPAKPRKSEPKPFILLPSAIERHEADNREAEHVARLRSDLGRKEAQALVQTQRYESRPAAGRLAKKMKQLNETLKSEMAACLAKTETDDTPATDSSANVAVEVDPRLWWDHAMAQLDQEAQAQLRQQLAAQNESPEARYEQMWRDAANQAQSHRKTSRRDRRS